MKSAEEIATGAVNRMSADWTDAVDVLIEEIKAAQIDALHFAKLENLSSHSGLHEQIVQNNALLTFVQATGMQQVRFNELINKKIAELQADHGER